MHLIFFSRFEKRPFFSEDVDIPTPFCLSCPPHRANFRFPFWQCEFQFLPSTYHLSFTQAVFLAHEGQSSPVLRQFLHSTRASSVLSACLLSALCSFSLDATCPGLSQCKSALLLVFTTLYEAIEIKFTRTVQIGGCLVIHEKPSDSAKPVEQNQERF